ncbi:acyl-CoA thioesterase II [Rhodococcus sp. ACPA4]|uniref:Acyl-CoA thioesterase 2 n=2 Tax=Nocardiaceae TaxID=85025 RepID=A0A652YK45_NOCGL|nr:MULTISPECIES: acyl-CoA thioesterase II [Rhodococcus]NMD62036.1 acyl-CoA thioesterase II [Nocardia globerula]KJF22483.1 Acyl-CoA thioesterase 2 [Rhodococcus sp. AD45]MCE4268156.1 acyl-CoA thioesterase II [Rhodococcus globerulus]MDV6265314.1 acyl-CoA thioesterase II [Rhodococcus globerulus]MDV8070039.1 acyl-CoA thioesterase II [Rhodococcus sp. IEGM 1366]
MIGIEEILELETLEKDIFRGAVHPTVMQRTFGGQVAGQSLVSAVSTVDERFHVHSLHGYFLRPGNPKIPTVYLVDRIRDGRSFCTRRVNAVQDGKTIFSMSASFHVEDQGIEHQDRMPNVPMPEELPDPLTIPDFAGTPLHEEWRNWDLRIVPADVANSAPDMPAQQRVWIRYRNTLPDRPLLHICTLAYLSDMTLLNTSNVPHKDVKTQNASLDHAMWFLRPFRADEWLMYDQTSPSAGFGRALTQGRIYDRSGNMVAAVVQEGLSRIEREPSVSEDPSGSEDKVGTQA